MRACLASLALLALAGCAGSPAVPTATAIDTAPTAEVREVQEGSPAAPTASPTGTLAPAAATPIFNLSVTPDPRLVVSMETTAYTVSGATADELAARMRELGPNGFDGYTSWYVAWLVPGLAGDAGCATGPVGVVLRVVVTLPEWNPPAGAPRELVDHWNAYLASLRRHEAGHVDFGLRAANDILAGLQEFPVYRTCDDLDAAVAAFTEDVLNRYRSDEEEYDATTQHGATHGARFP